MANKVEMRPAYEWICDECGLSQFASAMLAEFSEEDRLAMAKSMGLVDEFCDEIPEDLTGDFVTHPERVTCSFCGSEFETVHPHEDLEG